MQFRQNLMASATLLCKLEKGSSHNIAECVRDQVQAQERQAEGDVPGDCVCTGCPDNPKKCNAIVLSRRVCWKSMVEKVTRVSCCRVVELTFLVSEKGDDRGGAWPWHAKMTAPKFELLVCSVHIANFASQTFVVTYQ